MFRRGSSPLARGTLLRVCRGVDFKGLIPARAGNTSKLLRPRSLCRAHPRSRGEHERLFVFVGWVGGSSPLARGTQWKWKQRRRKKGLIPARAGNTTYHQDRTCRRRAHPRSRGEHCLYGRLLRRLSGSSPLARGTPDFSAHVLKAGGLIPARAGNTAAGRA